MNEINVHSTISSVYFISICTYLGIDVEILGLYTFLLIIDFITGVIKGYTTKTLESNKAINGVFKKLILILLIFSIGTTGKIVGYEDLRGLLSFAFSSLAVAEMYSILANIYEIRTGKKTKEFDGVSYLISSFLKFIESKIKKIDNNKPENDKIKV